MKAKKFPALDDFRLIAVILVVANHTRSADGEFLWLLTVLRRVSVPFFIMVSGYFLARGNWRSTGKFLTKTVSSPMIKCKKTPRKKCRIVAEVEGKR